MHHQHDKDHPGLKKLGGSGNRSSDPYIVVADAAGNPLISWSQLAVNTARPYDPDKMIAFIDTGLSKLADVEKIEKSRANGPLDRDSSLKLANAYLEIGRAGDACKIFEELIAKPKEGEDTTEMRFAYAAALARSSDMGKAADVFDKLFGDLIDKKDSRLPDRLAGDRDGLLTLGGFEATKMKCRKLVAAFPEHAQVNHFRFMAIRYTIAGLAEKARDLECAEMKEIRAELEAIVAKGPETDQWVVVAKNMLAALAKRAEAKSASNGKGAAPSPREAAPLPPAPKVEEKKQPAPADNAQ